MSSQGWKAQAKLLPSKDLLKLIVLGAALPLLYFFPFLKVLGRAKRLKMIQQLEPSTVGTASSAPTAETG